MPKRGFVFQAAAFSIIRSAIIRANWRASTFAEIAGLPGVNVMKLATSSSAIITVTRSRSRAVDVRGTVR